MPIFLRPLKTLGNREYALEKAANPNEPIKSAEVDGDLDTIYNGVNGNLDTTNLAAAAAIVGTQLSGGANILGSQLSATAGIVGTQLAAGANILPSQTTVGSLTSRTATVNIATISVSNTTLTTVATLPALTAHGSNILLGGMVAAVATLQASSSAILDWFIVRNGSTIADFKQGMSNTDLTQAITVAIPSPTYLDVAVAAGATTYLLKMQWSAISGGVTWATNVSAQGQFFAMELF